MKRCPVCKTMLFDDMGTCYGCMYRFGSKPDLESRAQRQMEVPAIMDAAGAGGAERDGLQTPGTQTRSLGEFLVQFHRFLGDFLADASVKV